MIEKDGQTIHGLVKNVAEILGVDETSPYWFEYLNYVDGIVSTGFLNTIKKSLKYILDNMSIPFLKKNDLAAFLEVKLDLDHSVLEFSPSFREGNSFIRSYLIIMQGPMITLLKLFTN